MVKETLGILHRDACEPLRKPVPFNWRRTTVRLTGIVLLKGNGPATTQNVAVLTLASTWKFEEPFPGPFWGNQTVNSMVYFCHSNCAWKKTICLAPKILSCLARVVKHVKTIKNHFSMEVQGTASLGSLKDIRMFGIVELLFLMEFSETG